VVGVSMDEAGWRVLKPFLAETQVPYPILLGDSPTAHRFGIQSMPDTFLIDREGRVAAAYLTGLADKTTSRRISRHCSPKDSAHASHLPPGNVHIRSLPG
jgi:hypothetical protein